MTTVDTILNIIKFLLVVGIFFEVSKKNYQEATLLSVALAILTFSVR